MGDGEKKPAGVPLEVPALSNLEKRLLMTGSGSKAKPAIQPLPPNTDLLQRLQTFMPQMKEANENLEMAEGEEHEGNLELVDEGEPYIELDLACGLFDLKDDEAVAAAERSLVNQGVAVDTFSGGSTSSSSSSSDEEGDEETEEDDDDAANEELSDEGDAMTAGTKGKKKKKSGKHHPGIQELT